MLDLFRDAFNTNATVVIDYNITPPKKNGVIKRPAEPPTVLRILRWATVLRFLQIA
jgi:hypothetical protein